MIYRYISSTYQNDRVFNDMLTFWHTFDQAMQGRSCLMRAREWAFYSVRLLYKVTELSKAAIFDKINLLLILFNILDQVKIFVLGWLEIFSSICFSELHKILLHPSRKPVRKLLKSCRQDSGSTLYRLLLAFRCFCLFSSQNDANFLQYTHFQCRLEVPENEHCCCFHHDLELQN